MKNTSYAGIGLVLIIILSTFVLLTARNRSLIKPKNSVIKNSLDKTRTANLYKEYRRVVINALYFDWELRKLFIKNYAESYYKDKQSLLKQHQKEHNNLYTFFVFVSFQKSELQKPNSTGSFL